MGRWWNNAQTSELGYVNMVDVDWIQLLFVVGSALVAGGIAYGGARARSAAFEEYARREIDALRNDHRDLAHRFESCMFHHAEKGN